MSQFFMSDQQYREYSKFLKQAKHLKQTTFSNEFMQKCAWEDLVVQFYQFAAEVRPKETFYLLLCFTASDYQLTAEQLNQVFYDLSMMLKAYVRRTDDDKKRSKHLQETTSNLIVPLETLSLPYNGTRQPSPLKFSSFFTEPEEK